MSGGGQIVRCVCGRLVIYGQVCVCGHNLNKPRGADCANADSQRPAPSP